MSSEYFNRRVDLTQQGFTVGNFTSLFVDIISLEPIRRISVKACYVVDGISTKLCVAAVVFRSPLRNLFFLLVFLSLLLLLRRRVLLRSGLVGLLCARRVLVNYGVSVFRYSFGRR